MFSMKNIGAKPPKNAVLTGRSAEACDFVEPGCAREAFFEARRGSGSSSSDRLTLYSFSMERSS